MSRQSVYSAFRRLVKDIQEELPGFDPRFRWNRAAGDPSMRASVPECDRRCQARRAYAWALMESGRPVIEAHPRLARASDDRVEALLRHELAHALQFYQKVPHHLHTERGTDDLAEVLWGDRIYYDEEWVQTLEPGVHPRPEWLG